MLLLSLTLVSHFAYGQQTIHPSLLKAETFSHSLLPDSIEAPSSRESKSTMLAMAFSAVLPGAGQVYTERYWKIPIIWGFGIYFGSVWNRANISYKEARDKYQASLDQGVNAGGGDAQLRYERDFYRDERDRFAFYIALTYLLNIVDAYVGASLYNFDVSDYLGGNARISIQIPVR
ncbi:MAG: DUF5683 domain-containing protein [Bacteroidota bacterium]